MKKYVSAIGIWCLIVPLAIINGWLRENILIKLGGAALPLSGLILSACIFVMAYFFIPKIRNCKKADYIVFGIMWFVLTNLFDLGMILMDGLSPLLLLQAYDFRTGNLWMLVVIVTAFSPYLVQKLNKSFKAGV